MPLKVLVELSPSLDADHWAKAHAMGVVPDRVPYGLDRMADENLTVHVRKPPRGKPITLLSRASARLTGGARWPEAVLGRPRPATADVTLCWDERNGIPAVLAHRRNKQKGAVVTGAIWITEPDAAPRALAHYIAKSGLERADAIFVNSSGQIPYLRWDWGIPSRRIHFVHFGVDTDFWDPALVGSGSVLSGEASAVLSVGNDRHRDHELLLAAISGCRQKLPSTRLTLVTAKPIDVPEQLGYRCPSATHPQLRDMYQQAQVVAICTKFNTHVSGATAMLEAMSMGKTVVASRMPGVDDYIVDGVTGVLVPPNDPEAMGATIAELLQDPERCAELGAAARKQALAHFSTEKLSGNLAAIVRSVG